MSAVDIAPGYAEPARVRAPAKPVATPDPVKTTNTARLGQTIDLRQNRTAMLLTVLFAAVVVVLFASLWFGHYAKTETARGIVSATGGFSRLDAPKAGVIGEIYVKQGDRVEVGKPIYLLRLSEAGAGGETAVASEARTLTQSRGNFVQEIERAKAFIAQTREQQSSLGRDQASLMSAVDGQEKSVQNALAQSREKVQRVRALVQQGYATRDVLDTHERTYFEYERQLTDIKLKRVEYKRQDAEKRRDVAALLAEKENQRSNADNQINTIDAQLGKLKTLAALQVRAQASGQVLAINAKVGDSVEKEQFVAAIGNPDAEPLVVIDAPARVTGLLQVGQDVVLKYDAFPFKTFGIHHGTVTSISAAAIRAPEMKEENALDPRPVERQSRYRIEVKPDSNEIEAYGEKKRLKIGSTLSADIVIEKRRLIDWVLDPIRAMKGRV